MKKRMMVEAIADAMVVIGFVFTLGTFEANIIARIVFVVMAATMFIGGIYLRTEVAESIRD